MGKDTFNIDSGTLQYIIDHLNDRPRTIYIEKSGVSASTFYRVVREYGGTLHNELAKHDDSMDVIIRKEYPEHSAKEISELYGFAKTTINRTASRLGIRHTENCIRRMAEDRRKRLVKSREKVDQLAKVRRWKATRKLDEYRMWEGKKQLTKFKLRTITKKAYKAKHYLMTRYGYSNTFEPYTLMRTKDMSIGIADEHYFERKYGLKFINET